MTRITLTAEMLAKFEAASGRVLLCDEAGNPVKYVDIEPYPNCEPVLSAEERNRRKSEPGGMSTAELVAYLQAKYSEKRDSV